MKFVIVVIIAQIICVIIGVLIAVFEKKTCLSASCKELSNAIKQSLDLSVNPCDDFYQFTCGKQFKRNDSESRGMLLNTSIEQMKRVLDILKEDPETGEPETFAKAKTVYKKCTKDAAFSGERKIRELFQEMGGFPILQGDKWNETGWSWLEAMSKIRKLGFVCDPMFTFTLVPNPHDHKTYLGIRNLDLSQYEVCKNNTLECEALFNGSFNEILLKFGIPKEQAEEDAVGIFNLEKQLFQLSKNYTPISLENLDEDNVRNLANLTAAFGYIDWPKLVSIILQKEYVPDSYEVLVFNPGYLEGLKTIFQTTSNKVKANYMLWSVLQDMVEYSLYPSNKTENDCFNFLKNTMGFALSVMYLNKYPDPRGRSLELIVEMVDLLKDDILIAIKNVDWMSDQARKKSSRKILLLEQRIGDLKVVNESFVEEYYRGLSVEGDVFGSMLSVVRFSTNRVYEVFIGKSASFFVLSMMTAFSVNAFYFGMENSFNVLHGILQEPVYDTRWPGSINYGRIGSIVGHEMTHALDATGHRYDEHGDLKDTWDKETYQKFNKTSQCLVDQFDTFYNASPWRSKGSHKTTENMADTGGSKIAFLAYRNHTETLSWPDFLLPGLDYSSNQLFFISFALFWCCKGDEEKLAADVHAPSQYRVLKTLRNNPYFGETFGCHHGDGMRSGIKCDIW